MSHKMDPEHKKSNPWHLAKCYTPAAALSIHKGPPASPDWMPRLQSRKTVVPGDRGNTLAVEPKLAKIRSKEDYSKGSFPFKSSMTSYILLYLVLGGISLNPSLETRQGTGEHAKRPEMHSWLESPQSVKCAYLKACLCNILIQGGKVYYLTYDIY